MNTFRLVAAWMVAAGLVLLPVSTAVAMGHAWKAEAVMPASGDDCPCCNGDASDACPVMCCHLSTLVVEGWVVPRPLSQRLVEGEAELLMAFVARPDPPPPRS
jgi:hypothetical protein